MDPGVLVSARISRGGRGAPAELLTAWLDGRFELIVSAKLLEELEQVLLRPKFQRYTSEDEVQEFVELLRRSATTIDDPGFQASISTDPDDDYLIALARAAGADALISGDRHLTHLVELQPPVLTPRVFLDMLSSDN